MTEIKTKRRRRPAKRDGSHNPTASPVLGNRWVKDTLLKAVYYPTTDAKFNKIVTRLKNEKRAFTSYKN